MSSPTEGTDTPSPSAISGSMPITTNSVVPIPNAPTARGRSARGTAGELQTAADGHDVRTDVVVRRGPGPAPEKARAGRRPVFPGTGATVPGAGGSGLEQHLDGAVLLLAEVGVRLRRLLEG